MTVIPKDDLMNQLNEDMNQAVERLTAARNPSTSLEEVNFQQGRIRAYRELAVWLNSNYE